MNACTIGLGLGMLVFGAHAGEAAAPPRDPMRPVLVAPPPPGPRSGTVNTDARPPVSARHLMVIDGRPYVIEAGHRRAVGDMLGTSRIEKIEDSAVIVRTGGGSLQRLPLFAGVIKQAPTGPSPTTVAPAVMGGPVVEPSNRSLTLLRYPK